MSELFKTVLTLSLFGFGITAVLLCLKPITAKRLPARWQYGVWIVVLLSMILPAYKLIPREEARKIPLIIQTETARQEAARPDEPAADATDEALAPLGDQEVSITPGVQIKLWDLAAYIWLFGMCLFLLAVLLSYALFLSRKRKRAVPMAENQVFEDAKKELSIRRRIRIRRSEEGESPMLVGVLFPVIYIPEGEISDESLRMVFLHELMHYKRKDLVFKWLSVFVNAVHWFNPLVYLLFANVSEACEVSCDMAVTKSMPEEERKLYMKTILDLVEERQGK